MLVTVVTPSINGRRYLTSCIDSVQQQRSGKVDVEHIFVDGGSTDGTPEYAASRGCTVLTREEHNLYVAFNKGFRNASGDLISILGCDDMLLPGALELVRRRYERERLPWLLGGIRWLNSTGRSRGDQPSPPRWMTTEMLGSLHWSPFPSLSAFLEPEFLKSLGHFDTSFEYASDYDLLLRARKASRYSRIEQVLSAQRRHGGNLSMQPSQRHVAEVKRINAQYGPATLPRRRAYAAVTRLALNAMSPMWFAAKRVDGFSERTRRREDGDVSDGANSLGR